MSSELERAFRAYVRSIVRELVAAELASLLEPAQVADEPLIDAEAVARMLGSDTTTEAARRRAKQQVYYLVHSCGLPAIRLGNKTLRFKPAAVHRWIDDNETETRVRR